MYSYLAAYESSKECKVFSDGSEPDVKQWFTTEWTGWINISISHLVGGPRLLVCPLFVVPDVPPLDLQRIRSRAWSPKRTGHLHILPTVRRHVMRDLCEESWWEKDRDREALKAIILHLQHFKRRQEASETIEVHLSTTREAFRGQI